MDLDHHLATRRPSPYVWATAAIRPADLHAAFDLSFDLATSGPRPRATFAAGASSLSLASPTARRTATGTCASGPLLRSHGTLRWGHARLRVEMDVNQWSSERIEVGLRPVKLRGMTLFGEKRYFTAARAAVDLVAAEIEAWGNAARAARKHW